MIGLALIAAVVILVASVLGGWAGFVVATVLSVSVLGLIAAVLLVFIGFAESLTDAIEHLTEPIRGPRR